MLSARGIHRQGASRSSRGDSNRFHWLTESLSLTNECVNVEPQDFPQGPSFLTEFIFCLGQNTKPTTLLFMSEQWNMIMQFSRERNIGIVNDTQQEMYYYVNLLLEQIYSEGIWQDNIVNMGASLVYTEMTDVHNECQRWQSGDNTTSKWPNAWVSTRAQGGHCVVATYNLASTPRLVYVRSRGCLSGILGQCVVAACQVYWANVL